MRQPIRSWALRGIIAVGLVLLLCLMVWQIVRATGRAARIEVAELRLNEPPTALPAQPNAEQHDFQPVSVTGRFDHAGVQVVLASTPRLGPGGRLITPFHIADRIRPILVDRGFVPERVLREGAETVAPVVGEVEITGVLAWPREVGRYTPERDSATGLWFARDVPRLAEFLNTDPVLVIARDMGISGWPRALPPRLDRYNVHIEYAVTWGALAVGWLVIGVVLVRRERTRNVKDRG